MATKRVLLQNGNQFFFGNTFSDIVDISDSFGDNACMNAEIFRHNLREMLRVKGLKQREFAEKAGLSYPWVRKVCSQGLTRAEDRNREQLEKVCEFLGVTPVEEMWHPKLLDRQEEASAYAAKVEEVLRACRLNNEYFPYESVGEISVTDFVNQIEKVYEAFQVHRRSIEEGQRRSIEATQKPKKARSSSSQASDYAEKIRSLLRDDRPELQEPISEILQLIDGAYHFDDGKRLEQRLRKEHPDGHKRWLSSFGGNVGQVIIELASAVPGQDEDEFLDYLADHEPPDKGDAIRVLHSFKQRQTEETTSEDDEWDCELEAYLRAGKQVQQEPDSSGLPERFRNHLIRPRPT